jgi:L-carnitine CoA-transferase
MWANKNLPQFGSLQGVKVVHQTGSTAGPFAVQLLADQGADVVWLESAAVPDLTRMSKTWSLDAERRNQRGMAVNLPTPEGKEILAKLLADADVYVENTKGNQYEKWGLTDDVLWAANPRLVICHISGFGHDGLPEYVGRPSYDSIAQAFCGYMNVNRNPQTAPYSVGPYTVDFITALFAAYAITAALYRVRETGVGESIDCAQVELAARAQQYSADWFTAKVEKEVAGNPSPYAGVGAFLCKDGAYIQLSLGGAAQVQRTCEFLGIPYGDEDIPAGTGLVFRGTPGAEKYDGGLIAYFATKTAKEAETEMLARGLAVNKVNTMEDFENDPQIQARGVIQEWVNAKGATVRAVGPVPKFERNPGRTWRAAPNWGQDNEEVLAELGYTPEQVTDLYERRILNHDPEGRFTMPYDVPGKG